MNLGTKGAIISIVGIFLFIFSILITGPVPALGAILGFLGIICFFLGGAIIFIHDSTREKTPEEIRENELKQLERENRAIARSQQLKAMQEQHLPRSSDVLQQEASVHVMTRYPCINCNRTGRIKATCSQCQGSGRAIFALTARSSNQRCDHCQGRGWGYITCPVCRGDGYRRE